MTWANSAGETSLCPVCCFFSLQATVKKMSPTTEIVFWCHNVTGHESRPLEARLTRFAFAHGDKFIVHGERIKESFEKIAPAARVMVADMPVYDVFAAQAVTRGEARGALGIDSTSPVVLYFGFVRRYKGLAHLIDAMPAALEILHRLRAFFQRLVVVVDRLPKHALVGGIGIRNQLPGARLPLLKKAAGTL